MKFILASASPRRKELLEQIGMKFEVRVSEAEEITQATEPAEYVMDLSFLKAEDVAGKIPVMYDARGVRRETGEQAKVLNEMIEIIEKMGSDLNYDEKLKEFVGHTPLQVLVGAILGIIVALVYCLVIIP